MDGTAELGSRSLADPFPPLGESYLQEWYEYLIDECPLWSFQKWKFAEMQDSELPSIYPLRIIARSVLDDDELDHGGDAFTPVDHQVYSRRVAIATNSVDIVLGARQESEEGWMIYNGVTPLPDDFLSLFDLAYFDHADGYVSEYEFLGRQLVGLVEDRERARHEATSEAREEAEEALDDFLGDIAVRLPARRPTRGPSDEMLEALFEEGRVLFEVLWDCLPFRIAAATDEVLAARDVADEHRGLAAARLAVPVLSSVELEALMGQHELASEASGSGERPTARRFTCWVIARRLDLDPVSTSRKLLGSRASDYFRSGNPF